MSLKVVLFDMGGTLVTYGTPDGAAGKFHEHADEVGLSSEFLKATTEGYLEARKDGFKTLNEAVFFDIMKAIAKRDGLNLSDEYIMEALKKLYNIFFGNRATLIEGSKELLDYIKSRGISIGLISNTAFPGEFHEADFERFGVLEYFDLKLWTSAEKIRKPHPALFEKALKHFGANSEEAVYIGDAFNRDVIGANGVGMKAIWISCKIAPKPFDGWRVKDLFEAHDVLSKIM